MTQLNQSSLDLTKISYGATKGGLSLTTSRQDCCLVALCSLSVPQEQESEKSTTTWRCQADCTYPTSYRTVLAGENHATETLDKDKLAMNSLKVFFIEQLLQINSKIHFNGQSSHIENSSCTILNVLLPVNNELLLFNLDLYGIAVSGGSACQSGSATGSHVLSEITNSEKEGYTSVRFSFSRYTTIEDINYAIQQLKKLL